jgi:hypothetical protein
MREPIFHDRQVVTVAGPLATTSAIYVDIPGAILTTKDLSVTGLYQLWLSMELEHSNNNSTINVRICIDGAPSMGRSIHFGPSSAGNPQSPTLIGEDSGVDSGSVIQVQWNTPSGTATLNDLIMMIDGVPDSRIIT